MERLKLSVEQRKERYKTIQTEYRSKVLLEYKERLCLTMENVERVGDENTMKVVKEPIIESISRSLSRKEKSD